MSSTGLQAKKRKLYTDRDQIRFASDSFVAITSREPKFKRDDLVSRLLIFYTKEIEAPLSRNFLLKSLLENRNRIMTEVITNLNTVVKILKTLRDEEVPCIMRIADWESLGRKMCCRSFEKAWLARCISLMNTCKGDFALEDDYLFMVLNYIIYEEQEEIRGATAQGLYTILLEVAKEMKILDFAERYKSARSISARFRNIKKDLAIRFKLEIGKQRGKQLIYSIGPLPEESEPAEPITVVESKEPAKAEVPHKKPTREELSDVWCSEFRRTI